MTAHRPDAQRHSHTIDYFRELLTEVPVGAQTALDIGCGEGFAARAMAARGIAVTAVDLDDASLGAAREQGTEGIDYLYADFLTAPLAGNYDVVTALAVLHHVDLHAGLARCSELLAPGGVLLVVGCAASELPRDLLREAAAAVGELWSRLRHPARWDHPSPTVWPPPVTYSQVRKASARLLPGSRFRRRLLWRYTLVWTAPEGPGA